MPSGLHVNYPLFLSYFNWTSVFWADIRKYIHTKFHGNPSSRSRVVQCGSTDM